MVMGTKSLPDVAKRLSRFSSKVDALFALHARSSSECLRILSSSSYDDAEALDYALGLIPKDADKPVVYVLMRGRRVIFLLPEGPLEVDLEATLTAG